MYYMFYFYPIRSKEPPFFNFPTLDFAKYFYKMAATAGPSCGEMGLNSQNKNCPVSHEIIGRENWIVNANIFHYTQKKIEMIIGPKLDRVNRPLNSLDNARIKIVKIYSNCNCFCFVHAGEVINCDYIVVHLKLYCTHCGTYFSCGIVY